MQMPGVWMDQPVTLHSSRMDMCKLTPAQCAYRAGHWRYWYQADLVYALNTVYFCIAVIALFTLAHIFSSIAPRSLSRNGTWRQILASTRFLSYHGYYSPKLRWMSPSLGVMLLGAAGFVFFAAMTLGPQPYYWPNTKKLSYGNSPPIATRSGWMAIALLPFVIALPMKLNLITQVTGISHEKLQVFHRWTAYAMFVTALVHTFPFIIFHQWKGDLVSQVKHSVFYWSGAVALVAQAWLTFGSVGPLRNRFYEVFKNLHFLMAVIFAVTLFIHCDFRLTSWDYFIAAGVIYFAGFALAQLRVFLEHGVCTATLNPMPGEHVEVVIPMMPTATWGLAQHAFLRFLTPDLHSLASHPFTICSSPRWREMRFYARARGGFTRRLYHMARQQPGRKIRVLVDGPYGGIQSKDLSSFDRLLVVVGGSGAGLALPIIERTVQMWTRVNMFNLLKSEDDNAENETAALNFENKKILQVVMSTRSLETAQWFNEKVTDILTNFELQTASFSQRIEIHVTGPESVKLVPTAGSNPSFKCGSDADVEGVIQATIKNDTSGEKDAIAINPRDAHKETARGRPDIPNIIKEATLSSETVAVVACGPATMLHDTRQATAAAQLRILNESRHAAKEVYLHTEAFDW